MSDANPDENYEPSPWEWVSTQVEQYEASGGKEANTLMDTGLPIMILTTVGAKTGKVRKSPLMRVEKDGEYALVGSQGGAPTDPHWVANLRANPDDVWVQDGPEKVAVTFRQIEGDEKAEWWDLCVAAFPPYAEYQTKTDRQIPVFITTPK